MRILITGATGFIGSHLVESLIDEGNEVISFVKPNSDTSFIANIDTDITIGDLRDFRSIKHATEGIDVVYHLAAIPNWQGGVSRQQYKAVNVEGTNNVLEACRLNDVKRVLFTSSLEAVGPSINGNPVNEKTPANPKNIYGETKLEGERIAKEYNEKYGLEIIIVRLPMVYGPRNLLHLKRYFTTVKGGYYPIIGNGNTLIEFCYVNNAIYGIKLAMREGKPGEIYFISDEISYRFKEVILEIARQLNVNLKLLRMPVILAKGLGLSIEILSKFLKFYPFIFEGTGRPAFSRSSVTWMTKNTIFCDILKAKKNLGYKAPYNLQEGIRETIKWYQGIGVL
jgi:nucleoside-diphosphate-sugar epimerase